MVFFSLVRVLKYNWSSLTVKLSSLPNYPKYNKCRQFEILMLNYHYRLTTTICQTIVGIFALFLKYLTQIILYV